MLYVYQVLAAILIGLSIGAIVVTRRNKVLLTGALLGVVLGVATIVMGSWEPLAIGVAIFLISVGVQGAAVRAG